MEPLEGVRVPEDGLEFVAVGGNDDVGEGGHGDAVGQAHLDGQALVERPFEGVEAGGGLRGDAEVEDAAGVLAIGLWPKPLTDLMAPAIEQLAMQLANSKL